MAGSFIATGWKGATYGLRVGNRNRDQFFEPAWGFVELELVGGPGAGRQTVGISHSFWNRCPELRSAAIGRWFQGLGLAPWATGAPPRLLMEAAGERIFRVTQTKPVGGRREQ
jgi:hypothetical protein